MRVPVLTQKARFLIRSVAIIAIAGAAAGCSSNSMRFQDGIFTNSTSRQSSTRAPAPQPQQQYAQQPYPGDVDRTSTGSINRPAVQPVNVASRGRHPVPSATLESAQADGTTPPGGVSSLPADIGLAVISGLAEEASVEPTPKGTTIRMRGPATDPAAAHGAERRIDELHL
jgi:hypothetical protein